MRIMLFCGCAAIVIAEGMICASEAEVTNTAAMPEMVITASRAGRDPATEAAAIYTIPAQDQVAGGGVRTTPDMLGGIPSVMVQKTGYGQGSPYILDADYRIHGSGVNEPGRNLVLTAFCSF